MLYNSEPGSTFDNNISFSSDDISIYLSFNIDLLMPLFPLIIEMYSGVSDCKDELDMRITY